MNDWLDASLKARPVIDDGFADRVIAVGRAQDRTRLLLRLLVAVLAMGMVASAVAGCVLHTVERLEGQGTVFGTWATPAMREDAFVRDWQRLAGHPALRRQTGGESADARLTPVAEHINDQVAGRPCRTNPIDDACDTTFLVGLRQFSRIETLPPHVGMLTWATIVRGHLVRAAARDGATFAAAVDDAHALARMLIAHRGDGAAVFAAVGHEIDRARARGQDTGGATPLFTTADADRLGDLWWEGPAFLGVEGSPAARALVADSPSVIACGARRDIHGTLDALITFAADDDHRALVRRVAESSDGCAPRHPLSTREVLCEAPDGALCTVYVATLQLPGIRGLMAPLLSPPPRHWEMKE